MGFPSQDNKDIITLLVQRVPNISLLSRRAYDSAKMPSHPPVVMGSLSPKRILVPSRASLCMAQGG